MPSQFHLNGLACLATTALGSAATATSISIQAVVVGSIPAVLAAIRSNPGLHNRAN